MTVTASPDVALAVARSGAGCVLIASTLPESPVTPLVTAPRPGRSGPGRIALLVGDPSDPLVQAAAAAMDEELFGPAT